MVHAHFDDSIAVRRRKLEQGQRQTDVVVEIAGGSQNGFCAELPAQHRGQHFFDCGFAGGAGDAEHKRPHLHPPGMCQGLQRRQCVGHRKGVRQTGAVGARHHRISAARQHLRHKVVAVVAVALQSHKHIAGLRGTAVGDDAGGGIAGRQRQRQGLGNKV